MRAGSPCGSAAGRMVAPAALMLMALAAGGVPQRALAQVPVPGSSCGGAGWTVLGSGANRLAFVAHPAPPPVGRHFRIEIQLCAPESTVRQLRVDADMPAHRHGMNYRATVKPLGAGRWQADGLLFHMPGRWRFVFDLETAQGTQRLTHEVEVE